MKQAYPIILMPAEEGGYIVYVPDFDINTQGEDIADAMYMARDAICMMGCYYQDEKKELPKPSNIASVQSKDGDIKTLVDIDFDAYRKRNDNRAVRKNCTIPSWLNEEAEKAGINFSATLQGALKEQLGIR